MEIEVGELRGLERTVEWLRPLVEKRGWDYCVVWKLNDDPSRFVEFVDCCCSGGRVSGKVKMEENGVMTICSDVQQKHPICIRACETLAKIPAAMPLYSGIHTDVAMKNPSVDDDPQETQFGQCLQNSSPGVLFVDANTTSSLKIEPDLQCTRPQTRSSNFPGSSSVSNPSNPVLDSASGLLSHDASLPGSLTNSSCSKKPKFINDWSSSKSQTGGASARTNSGSEQGYHNIPKHPHKEVSKAKNLEVERRRRSRIKEGEFHLRALVPNISKMGRVSIIGDAIEYIIELKKTVKDLEKELTKDDHGENADQGNVKLNSTQKTRFEFRNSEVQVEIHEICKRYFLLRIEAEQQPSGFPRLMEVVSSIGLQVEDINIASSHGLVLSSLHVEADREVQCNQLQEALIKGLCATTAHEVVSSSHRENRPAADTM